MFDYNCKRNDLMDQIQEKKEELINIGLEKGLQHNETILISQQLDKLIYKSQKLKLRNK
ncbi:aspartyl-phosphate phosphatase Spo0E family protein [Ornithinibacillus salinisoli]|uniref:Aspartyl-phosphate phosphatase Spo0E family protein n=1 Tax=Ornithinibacillus salinisoli TaxID=1848459 RepID=A0ABW4W424_9BACI